MQMIVDNLNKITLPQWLWNGQLSAYTLFLF